MFCRLLYTAMVLAFGLPGIVLAQEQTFTFDIPSQSLGAALRDFARESRQQVAFDEKVVAGKSASELKGTFTPRAALGLLLTGTGLTFQEGASGVFIVKDRNTPATGSASRTRLDQPQPALSDTRSDGSSTGLANAAQLEEVIVTAQKRAERLQDVPVPVTSIAAASLIDSNQVRLQDYFTRVPGLSVTPGDSNGAPIITIRGVATGTLGNPTVGIVVDDVPLGSSGSIGLQVPDIDPSDLASIEVLRGPQGTLYGASSIGGLIKYVTVDPSTTTVNGTVQGSVLGIHNGDGAGYSLRGAVNIPLGDTLGVRASAFVRRDPGYIDDPALGARGVNRISDAGGRIAALWKPTDELSVRLSAVLQHQTAFGSSNAFTQPGLGDLQQNALAGTGYFDEHLQVYTAVVKAQLGRFDLVSVSGYNIHTVSDVIDYSPIFGDLFQSLYSLSGAPLHETLKTSKFTEELRLTTQFGTHFDWLLGVFYNHESSPNTQALQVTDPATGAVADTFLFDSAPQFFQEYALFTDLTWHLNDRFDVQFGGRESQNRQHSLVEYRGPYAELFLGANPTIYPAIHTQANSFTYLVTPRFKLSPDSMLYARLASGYRPGGPNVNAAAFGLPAGYGADKTHNYELGVKGDVANRTFSYDASLYLIDWKDIQLILVDPSSGAGYYTNAGSAKSQGIELSLESRPLRGLTISTWAAYNDAHLTRGFPADSTAVGGDGDRLPLSSRFSGNFSVEQRFPIAGDLQGLVGGSVSYVGDRKGVFTSSTERQDLPSYARTDLRLGLSLSNMTASLFVNNVTDRRAALNGGIGTTLPFAFNYIQPRTIGLSLTESF
ncbi:MAG: TonB-dependent receptor [Proteobacteria bacterium]|nr:TonB-dependent receptor [Pseudomonadota bacterium]